LDVSVFQISIISIVSDHIGNPNMANNINSPVAFVNREIFSRITVKSQAISSALLPTIRLISIAGFGLNYQIALLIPILARRWFPYIEFYIGKAIRYGICIRDKIS